MARKSNKVTRQEAFEAIRASAVNGKKPKVPCYSGKMHWRQIREFFELHCLLCKRSFDTSKAKSDHMKKIHRQDVCCSCHQGLESDSGGAHENVIPDELLEAFYQAIAQA